MNYIFISPHFPHTYWQFCDRLHRNGINVLGIGDAPYDQLEQPLREALTEYYRVESRTRACGRILTLQPASVRTGFTSSRKRA